MMRTRSHMSLLLVLVALIIHCSLKAQLYNMITYGLKDGLPEERLNCLMQDKDGYIWIGARFGLYKFNGKEFSTIPLPSTVRNRFVNYVFQDVENRIWVCLNGGGLILFSKNAPTQILITPQNTELDFAEMNSAIVNSVNRIYEIRPNLFFVLTDQGAFLFDGHRFTPIATQLLEGSPPGFPACYRATIINDSLWLQTSDHLYLFKTRDIVAPQLLRRYQSGGWPICLQGKNRLVIGHSNGLKYRESGDEYQTEHTLFAFPQSIGINNLLDQGQYTWASTNDGIFLFNGLKLAMHLTPSNGLPSSLVKDIIKDREQNYWVATDRGLVLFNDTINQTFLHANDRSSFVNAITVDSTGAVWCIQDNAHIWKINRSETTRIDPAWRKTTATKEPVFGYTALFSDRLKKIWTVYDNSMLQLGYHGSIKKQFKIAPWLNSIYVDEANNFWIVTNNMQVFHGGKILPVKLRTLSSKSAQIGSIVIDKKGTVWLADIAEKIYLGKISWNHDSVTINVYKEFSRGDGLVDMRYPQLAYDSIHDEIWAGSFWNGITRLRYRNDHLQTLHFNYSNGFTGERMMTPFFDRNGSFYCRSSEGLYHFIRNSDTQYAFDKFTTSDGLPANEIHALYKDADDNFWVGTHEGISHFHAGPDISSLPPPKVFVERISVNGEQKSWDSISHELSFAPAENAISFEFYATSYRNNSRLLYTYLLEGFDKNWSSYTTQNAVNYKNLPPGHYVFKVKSKNFLGIESAQPATVFFFIAAPFYKTGWFVLLLCMTFLIILIALYRYRIAQVRHEEKIKLQFSQQVSQLEIKALRSQMNPHFIFNSLNAINRYILKNEKEAASAYLTKFAKLIRVILDHSRQPRVPLSQELTALDLYLQLESLRFQNNFEYAVKIENDLNPQSLFIPPMIIQPIVENAIWHGLLPKGSNCSLKICFSVIGLNLICIIEDNGIGRTKAEEIQQQQMIRKSSIGMSTTIQRLKLLTEENQEDASITVEDLYDKFGNASGTKVRLLIPFTYK